MEQINDSIRRCEEQGRTAVLIIIHPDTYREFLLEMAKRFGYSAIFCIGTLPSKYNGVNIIRTSLVKDFFVVDDRSWAEQEF